MDLKNWESYINTGNPVVGADVALYAATDAHPNPNSSLSTTVTDSNGMWSFTGLAAAEYDVKVTYLGKVKWYKGKGRYGINTQTVVQAITGSTTSSGAYVDATGSVTMTTRGGNLYCLLVINAFNSLVNNKVQCALKLDAGAEVGASLAYQPLASAEACVVAVYLFTGVSAGSHTVKVRLITSANGGVNTMTISSGTLVVREDLP